MPLDRIALADFRNHRESALDGTRQFNLLLGDNGAGKTNILEALSLLAPGRGLRRATPAEMARKGGSGGFTLGADLAADTMPVRLGTLVDPARPNRRMVRINGADSSAATLGEWVSLGWLTPAMDGLFTDSAGARRRWLDRMALALAPTHARTAIRYDEALRERNRLLADDAPPDPLWLGAIEQRLAEHGAALASGRRALVAALTGALSAAPDGPFARPLLAYQPTAPEDTAAFAEALLRHRARDRAAGRTLIGPHRDELAVTMAGGGAPAAHCSTGEQKALLIAVTLAHAELAAKGRPAVLLLDEVAAHLDPSRRAALFERLRGSGTQVWMTGTEAAPFAAIMDEAACWEIAGGAAHRVS